MDKASKETDKILSDLERELRQLYNLTDEQIQSEIDEYLNGIYLDKTNATQHMRLKYAERNGLNDIVAIFTAYMIIANEKAINHVNETMKTVTATNFNYMRNYFKRKTGIDIGGWHKDTTLNKYSKRSFDKIIQKRYVSREILKELEKGIKQGESIPKLSKRVQRVSNRSRNNAKLVARTETTRLQNKSRMDSFKDAERLGIRTKKKWVSTHDNRTRHSHVILDGEVVGMDTEFSNGGLYPGDPNLPPEEVCNCRCTLAVVLKE